MKTIYLIGGAMGVGKTAVGQILKRKLNNSVFLDGDWCWDADPFIVTDETKVMALDNIRNLLNNFLHCSAYKNIIFCWVMHEQEIIDDLLAGLDVSDCEIKKISLICNENSLKKRLEGDIEKGIRDTNIIERSLARLPMYDKLDTTKIDTSLLTAIEVAEKIAQL